jgi:peptidoglycan-associated lipoprotein
MRNKWVILLLVMLLSASVGCTSKKSTIRGGAGEGGAGSAGGPGGASGQGGAGSDVISSETLKADGGVKDARSGGAGGGAKGGTGTTSGGGDGRTGGGDGQDGIGATQEKASPFQDIYFDFDQSSIRDDAKPVLAGIASYVAKNSVKQLIIEGHCDSRGTAEYNMALGERRAESAKKYLAALGVKSGALTTVSYGKEKPFMQGESEEAWAKNRRGHFLVR